MTGIFRANFKGVTSFRRHKSSLCNRYNNLRRLFTDKSPLKGGVANLRSRILTDILSLSTVTFGGVPLVLGNQSAESYMTRLTPAFSLYRPPIDIPYASFYPPPPPVYPAAHFAASPYYRGFAFLPPPGYYYYAIISIFNFVTHFFFLYKGSFQWLWPTAIRRLTAYWLHLHHLLLVPWPDRPTRNWPITCTGTSHLVLRLAVHWLATCRRPVPAAWDPPTGDWRENRIDPLSNSRHPPTTREICTTTAIRFRWLQLKRPPWPLPAAQQEATRAPKWKLAALHLSIIPCCCRQPEISVLSLAVHRRPSTLLDASTPIAPAPDSLHRVVQKTSRLDPLLVPTD